MKTKKVKATPKGVKISKEIDFVLTREDLAKKGENMSALDGEIDELELQFEEVKQNWRAKISTREAARKDISAVVRAKKERRMVDVVMVKDFEAKEITYWFEGAIVESRTMTESELQMEANFGNADKKAAPKKQKLVKHDPIAEAHAVDGPMGDIAEVHKLETSRRDKTSAVDGPTRA